MKLSDPHLILHSLLKVCTGRLLQGFLIILCLSATFLMRTNAEALTWQALWPSAAALIVVFSARSAFLGLLVGAISGAILLTEGSPLAALQYLFTEHFLPIFGSSWKMSALVFTLILGGFVALLEAGGGLQAVLKLCLGASRRASEKVRASSKRLQVTTIGFGLLVFFDGLANTLLIGRLMRRCADQSGVSRVKLAYLADTTGSAVACLAFISTWIAFQLAMIREGYMAMEIEVNAYALFFQSLPMNFYCWFALMLALISVFRNFNPGPMSGYEKQALERAFHTNDLAKEPAASTIHKGAWLGAVVPILVLTFSVPVVSYCIGVDSIWPLTLRKFATAYQAAESQVPIILVASSILASIAAAAWIVLPMPCTNQARPKVLSIFLLGMGNLLRPLAILIAAWMLGTAISNLGAATFLSTVLSGHVAIIYMPAIIFLAGACISFSTGTSWGTMAVLMPLSIPLIFAMTGEFSNVERDPFILAAIGAVFSGAVFGDHCSPFSDTTIIASIAAGVEPLEHFRTQLPFAALTGLVAVFAGFLPLGYGVPALLCLLSGLAFLLLIVQFYPKNNAH